ncbi:MAG: hypothetical protein DHS20C01_13550 [marine bacterium B5-7]|nr:MAG: hypothetical protein DHS20C01_13550 [marine bacterium B5-7]
MTTPVRIDNGTLVLSGVLDQATVPDVLASARELGQCTVDKIDATSVERVDSAGVAFLVWLVKQFCGQQGSVELHNPRSQLSSMLAVSDLTELFTIT